MGSLARVLGKEDGRVGRCGGVTDAGGARPDVAPRIHDIRHAFAVWMLLDWYRDDLDVRPLLPLLSAYLGHVHPKDTYWYLTGRARAARDRCRPPPARPGAAVKTALAPTLQAFFTQRLANERDAGPHTIASYRDTMRLLLDYAAGRLGRQPCQLDIAALDAPLIGAFLDHLEHERHNNVRTRNVRLAAIHSLFRYAQRRHPEHADDIARVLAIPPKRTDRPLVTFLADPEVDALLATPDRSTWTGRRDHALLILAIQTGLRASELIDLRCRDSQLDTGAHIHCRGKGRKQRITPLIPTTIAVLDAWLSERAGQPDNPAFPTARSHHLSRDALERRLAKYLPIAAQQCPTLTTKHVTLHTLRHTAATRLLHARRRHDRDPRRAYSRLTCGAVAERVSRATCVFSASSACTDTWSYLALPERWSPARPRRCALALRWRWES